MIANLLNERSHVVVVGNGPFSFVPDAVGYAACLNEASYIFNDKDVVLAYLLDEAQVGAVEALGFFGGEYGFHLAHIV